jgi:Ca2+-binding EF-hand superfamily protein
MIFSKVAMVYWIPAVFGSSELSVVNPAVNATDAAKSQLDALKETFASYDQNGDGFHSISEIQDTLLEHMKSGLIEGFNVADKNHDGVVTESEYLKFFTNKTKTDFDETDTNADGKHSLDEQLNHFASSKPFQQEMEAALKTAKLILSKDDKDNDGQLSEKEFLAHSNTLIKEVENEAAFKLADKNKDGEHDEDEILAEIMRVAGFVSHKDGGFIENGVEHAFNAADLDGDGEVSKEEYLKAWKNATEADFDRSDTNKDGRTTLEETMKHQSSFLADTEKLARIEAKHHIDLADKDGNSKLNLGEKNLAVSLAHNAKLFQAHDTNGDGFHDKDEIRSEMIRQAGYTAVVDGRKAGSEEFRYFLPDSFIEGFRRADTDKNEVVTEKEFLEAYKEHQLTSEDFKKHDHDGDGTHSLHELASKIIDSEGYKKLQEDAEAQSLKFISEADKDSDGKVSAQEFVDHLVWSTERERTRRV